MLHQVGAAGCYTILSGVMVPLEWLIGIFYYAV